MTVLTGKKVWASMGCALSVLLAFPSVQACEFFTSTLRVQHPSTRATALGASTAKVTMLFDSVTDDDRLIKVETPVATGAEIGGENANASMRLDIPAKTETHLTEAGTFIQLTGLKQALQLGRSYPMRLTFEKSGAIDVQLTVDYDVEKSTHAHAH